MKDCPVLDTATDKPLSWEIGELCLKCKNRKVDPKVKKLIEAAELAHAWMTDNNEIGKRLGEALKGMQK